ncbi:MAG: AarF/ABC1/UbiB kinase family protein [Candidatus Methanoperedens sp.]|nr:AarF/ABC1/UbiB kinase family protein [Candidatus Methanoperedens sp.]
MRLLDRGFAYVKRYREIISVLIKHGFGYAIERFGLRPFRSLKERIRRPKPLKEQLLQISEAERLRLAFEELGPTFIKFGQILSTRHDLIPEEYIRELSKLQDRVPPFEFIEAKKMIEKELGKNLDEIFSEFDEKPIASASIGQVYRGRLSTGEEVAVKVMRPGIEEIIENDLLILMSMARFFEKHVKASKFFNPVGFVEEFSRVMRQEIYYTHEAKNADKFYKNFTGIMTVRIPKIYWKCTTKHVLTQEYMEGFKITDIAKIEEAGLDRKKVSIDLSNAYLKMIFEDGFYHADPHPGNILVSPEGVIIFLDFGMAGIVDPYLRENLVNLMLAVQKGDIDLLLETLSEIGLIRDIGEYDSTLKANLEDFINEYYSLNVKFIDPTEFLHNLINVLIKNGGRIPNNIMVLSKTLLMRDEISRLLDPEHNFADLVEPYIKKIIEERTSISYIVNEIEKDLRGYERFFKGLPKQVHHILKKVEKGTIKFELEHRGFESLVEELDILSNRLSFSVIIAALIVGSALIIQTRMEPSLFGVPFLGIFGFLLAGILGLGLLVSIIRSGRW